MQSHEANFDGLVGPTHNYAGLSLGNIASTTNKSRASNPKNAAMQGLEKMKTLADAGYIQGVFPPHQRPHTKVLRRLGFTGSDKTVIQQALKYDKNLVSACYSSSNMWVANAATVSPSADTQNGKVHFTPANLVNNFHRAIETETTAKLLKIIFADEYYFTHHQPLPEVSYFSDEGAANHIRLCNNYTESGVEVFVFGKSAFTTDDQKPKKFPARQTLEACEAVARKHQLEPSKTIFLQQNPLAIDHGVFHNDVISVGNKQLLFCHQHAFINQKSSLKSIREKFTNSHIIEVPADKVSIEDAVTSYLFNSQLLELANNKHRLLAPQECKTNKKVWQYLQDLLASSDVITELTVAELDQSMNNGGGPACLRLRVVLTANELAACNQNCILTDDLYLQLKSWINKHYRDYLTFEDLSDESLIRESYTALDELTQILNLGSLYDFQI